MSVPDGIIPAVTTRSAGWADPSRAIPGRVHLLLIPFAILVLTLRLPEAVGRPQFYWEETREFWLPTFTLDPVTYFLRSWSGQLVVLPRAVFLVARLAPFELAPAVTVLLHAVVVGTVASFLASARLAPILPDARVRLAIGVIVLILPVRDPYLGPLSIHWFLALYVVSLAVLPDRRPIDVVLVPLAVVSGLGAVAAVPLLWWRRDRLSLVATIAAGAQGIAFLLSNRVISTPNVSVLIQVVPAAPFLILAIWAARRHPSRDAFTAFGFLALATLLAGAVVSGQGGDRYLLAGLFTLGLIGVATAAQGGLAGVLVVTWLVALSVVSLRLTAAPSVDWAAHAHCIGGPVACDVPAWPLEWSVSWRP